MAFISFIYRILYGGNDSLDGAMIQDRKNIRGVSHGVHFLGALSREGRTVFSTSEAKEFATSVGVPEGYLNNLLGSLVRDGWLLRLRRGLFARFGSGPGDFQVHPFAIATNLVKPSAISHWSALNHHGLTEQIPRVVTAFTLEPSQLLSVPDFDNKITFNELDPRISALLKYGSYQAGVLESYFEFNSDFMKQELRDTLNEIYINGKAKDFDFPNKGFCENDILFFNVLDAITPKDSKACQDAALVVIAYFFEACDIFEDPDQIVGE